MQPIILLPWRSKSAVPTVSLAYPEFPMWPTARECIKCIATHGANASWSAVNNLAVMLLLGARGAPRDIFRAVALFARAAPYNLPATINLQFLKIQNLTHGPFEGSKDLRSLKSIIEDATCDIQIRWCAYWSVVALQCHVDDADDDFNETKDPIIAARLLTQNDSILGHIQPHLLPGEPNQAVCSLLLGTYARVLHPTFDMLSYACQTCPLVSGPVLAAWIVDPTIDWSTEQLLEAAAHGLGIHVDSVRSLSCRDWLIVRRWLWRNISYMPARLKFINDEGLRHKQQGIVHWMDCPQCMRSISCSAELISIAESDGVVIPFDDGSTIHSIPNEVAIRSGLKKRNI